MQVSIILYPPSITTYSFLFFLFLIFPEKDIIIRQETTTAAISANATTD